MSKQIHKPTSCTNLLFLQACQAYMKAIAEAITMQAYYTMAVPTNIIVIGCGSGVPAKRQKPSAMLNIDDSQPVEPAPVETSTPLDDCDSMCLPTSIVYRAET